MKKLIAVLILAAGAMASAQIGVYGPGVSHSTANPLGLACGSGSQPVQFDPSGAFFTCQTGAFAAVSSGGTFTALTGDATSTATGGATTVTGLQGVPVVNAPAPQVGYGLFYDGVAWTPSPAPGGTAQILYVTNTASDISTYDVAAITPAGGGQFTLTNTIPATATKTLIQAFATASGYPNITVIPAGDWQFDTYWQVSSATNTITGNIDVYDRTSGGVETLLFSATNFTLSGGGTGIQAATITVVEPTFAILASDRVVVKYSMTKTGGGSITGTLYGGGTTNYTHVHTPIGILSGLYVPLAGGTMTGTLNGTAFAASAAVSGATLQSTQTGAAPSTSPVCPNGTGGTLTTSGCVAGTAAYNLGAAFALSTTTPTVALTNGAVQTLTLTGNTTIAFTQPVGYVGIVRLVLTQAGGGNDTVTWTSVKWPSGIAPVMTATASAIDVYSCILDGTFTYCTAGQSFQ